MREKPTEIEQDVFDAFEKWADEEGVGTDPNDWEPWFECWIDGYCKGANDWKD